MAHRLAFAPNESVPIAVHVQQKGSVRLTPYDPTPTDAPPHADFHDIPETDSYDLSEVDLDLLALDVTPLDHMVPSKDSVWFRMRFQDTLGRHVHIDAREVVLGLGNEQHYGGVATNLTIAETNAAGETLWHYRPLTAWMRCQIRVNDALTDSDMFGRVTLTQQSPDDFTDVKIQILPQRVSHHIPAASIPLQAAEELGMAGWVFTWDASTFAQAPVMSVRAERDDTLAKISKDMSVDLDTILRANQHLDPEEDVIPGDLLRVPMLPRASTPAPRKVHPSVALTWREIVRGWTTLN